MRIDGYASIDGTQARNWTLSCQRAQAVSAELQTPSNGTPGVAASAIERLMHGETTEFSESRLSPNRRAVVTLADLKPPGGAPGENARALGQAFGKAPDGRNSGRRHSSGPTPAAPQARDARGRAAFLRGASRHLRDYRRNRGTYGFLHPLSNALLSERWRTEEKASRVFHSGSCWQYARPDAGSDLNPSSRPGSSDHPRPGSRFATDSGHSRIAGPYRPGRGRWLRSPGRARAHAFDHSRCDGSQALGRQGRPLGAQCRTRRHERRSEQSVLGRPNSNGLRVFESDGLQRAAHGRRGGDRQLARGQRARDCQEGPPRSRNRIDAGKRPGILIDRRLRRRDRSQRGAVSRRSGVVDRHTRDTSKDPDGRGHDVNPPARPFRRPCHGCRTCSGPKLGIPHHPAGRRAPRKAWWAYLRLSDNHQDWQFRLGFRQAVTGGKHRSGAHRPREQTRQLSPTRFRHAFGSRRYPARRRWADAGQTPSGATPVIPRPISGNVSGGTVKLFYVAGLPKNPLPGVVHAIVVTYKVQGQLCTTVLPFQVTSVDATFVHLRSMNPKPLDLAPPGKPPAILQPSSPAKVQRSKL